jgi:hypothetical protein
VVSLVAVEVAGGGLPLRVTVATQADVGETVLDVVVVARVVRDVDLVAVVVAVGARRVADLGTAGDVDRAAAGVPQGDGLTDGAGVDLLVRRARRVGPGGAAAARRVVIPAPPSCDAAADWLSLVTADASPAVANNSVAAMAALPMAAREST